jgi:hypothetical protein
MMRDFLRVFVCTVRLQWLQDQARLPIAFSGLFDKGNTIVVAKVHNASAPISWFGWKVLPAIFANRFWEQKDIT